MNNLSTCIKGYELSESPFYKAWAVGTLPEADLRVYASEYGAFISVLPKGWTTLSDAETAHEEQEHAELWEKFASSIGASVSPAPALDGTRALIGTAERLFGKPATAVGAMFAFEVQQPETATSKLEGLQKHYTALGADEEYFEEHTHNQHESEKLARLYEALPETEKAEADAACAEMARALRGALDGMYSGEVRA